MSSIVYNEQLDAIPNLYYRDPKQNKYKAYAVYVNTSETSGQNFSFQFGKVNDPSTWCKLPFGVSEPFKDKVEEEVDFNRKTVQLQVTDVEMQNFIRALDRKHTDTAIENVEKWFRKKMSPEHVEMLFKPCLDFDKENKYPPKVRAKIQMNTVEVWKLITQNGKQIVQEATSADITKGCKCIPMIELSGLWFMPKEFGATLVVKKLLIMSEGTPPAFNFVMGDGSEPPPVIQKLSQAKSVVNDTSPCNFTDVHHENDDEYLAAIAAGKMAGISHGNGCQ